MKYWHLFIVTNLCDGIPPLIFCSFDTQNEAVYLKGETLHFLKEPVFCKMCFRIPKNGWSISGSIVNFRGGDFFEMLPILRSHANRWWFQSIFLKLFPSRIPGEM